MRIATWNVNSLKARLDKVTWWLERAAPDVLLLQETKLADDARDHLVRLAGGDARREAQALEVMIADATDDAERLELYQRLATVLEDKLGAYSSALDVMLQAVVRYPSELVLWDRAEALSAASGRPASCSATRPAAPTRRR